MVIFCEWNSSCSAVAGRHWLCRDATDAVIICAVVAAPGLKQNSGLNQRNEEEITLLNKSMFYNPWLVKKERSGFVSQVHFVAVQHLWGKTGFPNPQWNAELDSVQPGWLMHQVPNTMQLLWWGDVLWARFSLSPFSARAGPHGSSCSTCTKIQPVRSVLKVYTCSDVLRFRLCLSWLGEVGVVGLQSSCAG